jgi:hypothetical protein
VLRSTCALAADALLEQLAAALATGKRAGGGFRPRSRRSAHRIAAQGCAAGSGLEPPSAIEAVLVDEAEAQAHPQWLLQLRREMAAHDGPIVPVVSRAEGYALERCCASRR